MDIESQTSRNTENIASLTTTVTEMATVVKYEVGRAKEDRDSVKDMVNELKSLNEKITAMAGVQKEAALASNAITELRTRVDQLKEWKDKFDLSKMQTQVEILEKAKIEEKGIKEAVTTGADWFWRIFGNAISAAVVGALVWGFAHSDYSASSISGKHFHGSISGE